MTKKAKNKTNTLLIVLVVWFALSAIYMVQDLWRNGISATYQAGYQKAITDIMLNSQSCQPFDVYIGENKTQLISISCLELIQKQAQSQQQSASEGAALVEEESVTN